MDQYHLCGISRADPSPMMSDAQVVDLAPDASQSSSNRWRHTEAEPGPEPKHSDARFCSLSQHSMLPLFSQQSPLPKPTAKTPIIHSAEVSFLLKMGQVTGNGSGDAPDKH